MSDYQSMPGGVQWKPDGTPIDQTTAASISAADRLIGADVAALSARIDDVESQPAIPPGGLPGDFLTRTATGYRWTPPLYDDGGTVADLSGLYFLDNGDGTVTPAHPTSYTDEGGTITMKGA